MYIGGAAQTQAFLEGKQWYADDGEGRHRYADAHLKTFLPDSIGYRIYACFISQPRFARSQTHCQLARLAQRQVKQPRHALAFGTRAPHTFDLNEMD